MFIVILIVAAILLYRLTRKFLYSRNDYLKNSIVLITGASEGIGASIAELLVQRGDVAAIHLLARNFTKLNDLKSQLQSKYDPESKTVITTHQCDCSKVDQVQRVRDSVVQAHGHVPNVIIHCAGIGRWRFIHEMTGEEAKECLNAPTLAAMLVTRAFLPDMLQRARQHSSNNFFVISSLQSPAAYCSWPGATAYTVSRWALRGFNESLRQDLDYLSSYFAVQEIVLGETESLYFANNPGSRERIPAIGKILPVSSPSDIARGVLGITKTGENGVFFYPWQLMVVQMINDWFPSIFSTIVAKTGYRLKLDSPEPERVATLDKKTE